jgi:hypothetical protein
MTRIVTAFEETIKDSSVVSRKKARLLSIGEDKGLMRLEGIQKAYKTMLLLNEENTNLKPEATIASNER